MEFDYREMYGDHWQDRQAERRKLLLTHNPGEEPTAIYGRRLTELSSQIMSFVLAPGYFDDMASLIDHHADVNVQDPEIGWTPLFFATNYECRPLLRPLIASGRCDYFVRDTNLRFAFEVAQDDSKSIHRLLIKKQAQQAFALGLTASDLEKLYQPPKIDSSFFHGFK